MSSDDPYAPGMRDLYPDVCWKMIADIGVCTQARGHGDGVHEPDAGERRREQALLEAARLALASYPWPPAQPLSDIDVYMEQLREAVKAYA